MEIRDMDTLLRLMKSWGRKYGQRQIARVLNRNKSWWGRMIHGQRNVMVSDLLDLIREVDFPIQILQKGKDE